MKIEINGNEKPEGYQITIEMKGSMEAKYVPNMVKILLAGIASHGDAAKYAVAVGVNEYIDSEMGERNESIF